MQTLTSQATGKERDRARLAADLAVFLRRGGEIKRVGSAAPTAHLRAGTNVHSPVRSAEFADD